ncbi:hypothetical protein FRAHR75_930018 [Frankia sp. Hr75.2]|nr:hypothetical protein FRAHR75_930018 [Frankia sp. Hr75.2]
MTRTWPRRRSPTGIHSCAQPPRRRCAVPVRTRPSATAGSPQPRLRSLGRSRGSGRPARRTTPTPSPGGCRIRVPAAGWRRSGRCVASASRVRPSWCRCCATTPPRSPARRWRLCAASPAPLSGRRWRHCSPRATPHVRFAGYRLLTTGDDAWQRMAVNLRLLDDADERLRASAQADLTAWLDNEAATTYHAPSRDRAAELDSLIERTRPVLGEHRARLLRFHAGLETAG